MLYRRKSGWLYIRNKDYVNKIILARLTEEECNNGPIINPFLTANIDDIKLKMIKKLTEKLNTEMIYNFIDEGNFINFDKNSIPCFSESQLKAANVLVNIAQQCTVNIIIDDIKREYYKYLLLKETIEHDLVTVIGNIFIWLYWMD